MKLRKAIKSIVAVGTGIVMLGATVMGASAAGNLADYPNQFIQDGKFNGLLVVGAAAKTDDVLGVVDIATGLQFDAKSMTTNAQTSAGGETVGISYGSDLLEVGERLGKVREVLTEGDLDALKGGYVKTTYGATKYNQYLRLNTDDGATKTGYIVFGRDENDAVADFLFYKEGDTVFEYNLEFEEGAVSVVETKDGDAVETEGGFLTDLEDESLNILGEPYSIVKAEVSDLPVGKITLTLLGGDVTDIMKEQETKTYTIDGKDYEVTVLIVSDDKSSVKFLVNGEETKELDSRGETATLTDGTVIGIKTIMPNEGVESKGDDLVEFFLGANKVVLSDTNYADDAYDAAGVKVDDESIEDAAVKIVGSVQDGKFKLEDIDYRLKADSKKGDVYIPAGEGLRSQLDEPQGMLGKLWDIKYAGLDKKGPSIVEFNPQGDEGYELSFTTQEGLDYTIPFVDNSNNEGLGFKYGDDDNNLVFVEGASEALDAGYNIARNDEFVLTKMSSNEKAFTRVLRFDSINEADGILSFTDVSNGATKEVVYSGTVPTIGALGLDRASGELNIGGATYKVFVAKAADNNYVLAIDQTGDGVLNGGEAKVVINGGGILDLGNAVVGADIPVSLTTLSKKFDEFSGDEVLSVSIFPQVLPNKVDLDVLGGVTSPGYTTTLKKLKGTDEKQGITKYGVLIKETDFDDSDADTATLEYPTQQSGADVYVTVDESVGKTAVTTQATEVNRIQVGKSVLDTSVSNVGKDNLIVVGGPCVNSVAATLMGNPLDCTAGFEEGKAIVKLFENGNKVSMLVAGYSAADTRRAAQVVANYGDYAGELTGDEVVISGTGLTVTDVSAPTQK